MALDLAIIFENDTKNTSNHKKNRVKIKIFIHQRTLPTK